MNPPTAAADSGVSPQPAPERKPKAYVREADPEEYDEVAWVLARAYARDPCMNWYGCVKELFPAEQVTADYKNIPKKHRRTLKNICIFEKALMRATVLSGGLVTVSVLEGEAGGTKATDRREVITGAAIWLKPGQPMDFSTVTILRSGLWKVLRIWGFTGFKVRLSNMHVLSSLSEATL